MSRPKFSLSTTSVMDFNSKTEVVANEVPCETHKAEIGMSCWHIRTDAGLMLRALCGPRTRKLFTGEVSTQARSIRRQTKEKKA